MKRMFNADDASKIFDSYFLPLQKFLNIKMIHLTQQDNKNNILLSLCVDTKCRCKKYNVMANRIPYTKPRPDRWSLFLYNTIFLHFTKFLIFKSHTEGKRKKKKTITAVIFRHRKSYRMNGRCASVHPQRITCIQIYD